MEPRPPTAYATPYNDRTLHRQQTGTSHPMEELTPTLLYIASVGILLAAQYYSSSKLAMWGATTFVAANLTDHLVTKQRLTRLEVVANNPAPKAKRPLLTPHHLDSGSESDGGGGGGGGNRDWFSTREVSQGE